MDPVITSASQGIPELCHFPGCHEPFSALSHLAGAVLFLFLGAFLLQRGRGDRTRLAFLGVYAASCVLLFTMSSLFHMAVRGGSAHRIFERLDHSAIFLLVAGTFTPIHGLLFQGWLRWGPLILIWTGALLGITLKTIFFEQVADWFGLFLYLALGWFGVFGVILLARRHGFTYARPLLLGGLVYSIGGILDLQSWPIVIPGWLHAHELFHVTVLLGALLHWGFIWRIARSDR
ncbi:MAG: hemolysin III family protein [Planctomycetes bacterium]|nr:hemolysin III family protein [Planctomycetota bacterium]